MSEMDWMYDSLTERFGEALGERQKVVDALLIAKAVVGPGTLGSSNTEGILSVARFILDEWGKYSDAEEAVTENPDSDDGPVVLNVGVIGQTDINLMKYGVHTFPEGSRWRNDYGITLVFTNGKFMVEETMYEANIEPDALPFIRIDKEN